MIRRHGQTYVRYEGRHYRVTLAFAVPHYVCPACNRCYTDIHAAHVHRDKCAAYSRRARGSYTLSRNALNYSTRKRRYFSILFDKDTP